MNSKNNTLVQSDITLLEIIEELRDRQEAGVTELADSLGMPKSTVHKHLQSLKSRRYVINEDGTYRLSLRFLEIGGQVRNDNDLATVAEKRVDELVEEVDLPVAFSIKSFDQGVFVFRKNYRYGLTKEIPVGRRFKLHENAAGKAMLATLSNEEIIEIVDRQGLVGQTEQTISDRDELLAEINKIRERGYALNFGEDFYGINAIGASVSDEQLNTIGALSIAGPENKLTKSHLKQEYAEPLLTKVTELKIELNYQQSD